MEKMRERFRSADDRPESELRQEARLLFDSRLAAFKEIGIASMFGSKKFLAQAAQQEKRAIDAGRQPPANVVAERAYFVDCLNDEFAAYAERWKNLLDTADAGLGERRAHFKDRRKPRLLRIEELAMVYFWAETIVVNHDKAIPPLCFMTDVAAAKFLELLLPTVAQNDLSLSRRPTHRTLSLGAFRQRRKGFKLQSSRFSYIQGIEVESSGLFRLLFGIRKNMRGTKATNQ